MKNDALINLADNLKTKGLAGARGRVDAGEPDKNSRREIANQRSPARYYTAGALFFSLALSLAIGEAKSVRAADGDRSIYTIYVREWESEREFSVCERVITLKNYPSLAAEFHRLASSILLRSGLLKFFLASRGGFLENVKINAIYALSAAAAGLFFLFALSLRCG